MKPILIIDAVTSVRKVSLDSWEASSWVARWLVASRASVLVMTFSSAAVGALLAAQQGAIDVIAWGLCLIGLLLAHAANNQLNDLTDSVRGIDKDNYFRNQYGAHPLEEGLLSKSQLIRIIVGTLLVALAIGLYLTWHVGQDVLWLTVAGAVLLLTYTYPLKQWGLGEIAVLLVWGPLMVGGSYLVASGSWSWTAAAIGALYAIGPTAVIFGKHIDKLTEDRDKAIFTLPVRLGEPAARRAVIVMSIFQYLGVLALVALGYLPWLTLICLGALPAGWRMLEVYKQPRPQQAPANYSPAAWPLWYVAFAFVHTRRFGLLFIAGLSLALLFL